MQTNELIKFSTSEFNSDQSIFYLKSEEITDELFAVDCKLTLQSNVGGIKRSVKLNQPTENYQVLRFVNPYLNAENDLFKLTYSHKTIGLIIPGTALEEDDQDIGEDFDEYKQAYKFYTVKSILENSYFPRQRLGSQDNFSNLIDRNSIYVTVYLPSTGETDFDLKNFLPSLALRGYYYYPENVSSNILSMTSSIEQYTDLATLIDVRFLYQRENSSLQINKTSVDIDDVILLKLLYKKLLIQNNNPLFRFLVLYQVIEFLLDRHIRMGINKISNEKDNYNNFDFFKEVQSIYDTRKIINKLFDSLTFNGKNEITNSLRDFILQNDANYKKTSVGDCLYDIRNLLFHDYKKVMEVDNDGIIIGLIIQCEILIHHLVISIDN